VSALILSLSAALALGGPAPGGLSQSSGLAGCVGQEVVGCLSARALDAPVGLAVSPNGRNVYVATQYSNGVAIFNRDRKSGRLTQKPGRAGCVTENGLHGRCQDGVALWGTVAVAVSPDGRNVYAVGFGGGAAFRRNRATGALHQIPSRRGCVQEGGHKGECLKGRGFFESKGVVVSPDGKYVYVSNSLGVASFHRNPATGGLHQIPGPAGCLSFRSYKVANCRFGKGMEEPDDLAISPNGRNVYATGRDTNSLAILDRDPKTGELTQAKDETRCISEGSYEDRFCADGRDLREPGGVAVSPDGRDVYVTGNAGVASFARNLANGKLRQLPGKGGCIGPKPKGIPGCAAGRALRGATAVAVSPDGGSVFVASIWPNGVAVLGRDRATGALTQHPSRRACIVDVPSPRHNGCLRGRGLKDPEGIAVSPNGHNVYAGGFEGSGVVVLTHSQP
jgi:DNA-binding beta-propeller fold protein YncE